MYSHGTHVAATAAGNPAPAVARVGAGNGSLALGTMSGVAPGAGLAVYRVLFGVKLLEDGEFTSFGTDADIIEAIEQAARDGADVINFSVSSSLAFALFQDPTARAWQGVSLAGVLPVAAGGNSGLDPYGYLHNTGPFTLTVAAGTRPGGSFEATFSASNGSAAAAVNATGPSYSWGAGAGGSPVGVYYPPAALPRLCAPGALDDAAAAGKIVLCDRGNFTRLDKSKEVLRAGGVGMVLMNVPGDPQLQNLVGDLGHSVPTVMVSSADRGLILAALADAELAGGGLAGEISVAARSFDDPAPKVADFSSVGPTLMDGQALLKPDILAPGVDIFAANFAPAAGVAGTGAFLSGTSMATPHVAGLAALIRSKRPSWTPAQVKSAIMTTASMRTSAGGKIAGDPFMYGSGLIDPARAIDPGVTYDATEADYLRYECTSASQKRVPYIDYDLGVVRYVNGVPPPYCKTVCRAKADCAAPAGFADINVPSFSMTSLQRGKAVQARRRLTFVGDSARPVEFTAALALPAGYTGRVYGVESGTATVTLGRASGPKEYVLEVTATSAAPKFVYAFGAVTFADAGGRWIARSPIALGRVK